MRVKGKSAEIRIGPWLKGLNNVKPLEELGPDELADCENFWFDERGIARTRPGLEKVYSGTRCSGLTDEGLFFDGGFLKKFPSGETLASGFTQGPFRWARIEDRLFFSDGRSHGRVFLPSFEVVEGFGCRDFSLEVSAEEIDGDIPDGDYLLGFSWVNRLGEESGAIVVPFHARSGIRVRFTGNVPADIDSLRIYAGMNEEELALVAEPPANVAYVDFTQFTFGRSLETLFKQAIPAPDLMTFFKGRLYFSKDNILYCSEPFNYGLFDPDYGEVGVFSEKISVVNKAGDSLFVVADKTYVFTGNSPDDFTRNVFDGNGVFGTGQEVEAKYFGGKVAVWLSDRGFAVGKDGNVEFVNHGIVEPGEYARGTGGVVEKDGMMGVVASVEDKISDGDSLRFADSISVRVISRGIQDV